MGAESSALHRDYDVKRTALVQRQSYRICTCRCSNEIGDEEGEVAPKVEVTEHLSLDGVGIFEKQPSGRQISGDGNWKRLKSSDTSNSSPSILASLGLSSNGLTAHGMQYSNNPKSSAPNGENTVQSMISQKLQHFGGLFKPDVVVHEIPVYTSENCPAEPGQEAPRQDGVGDGAKPPKASGEPPSVCEPRLSHSSPKEVRVGEEADVTEIEEAPQRKLKRRPSARLLATLERRPSLSLQVMVENPKTIAETYKLDKKVIGKGSYGVVKKGTVRSTGAVRAVKSIEKGSADSSHEMRTKVELETLKRIDHPNCLKLYELFEDLLNLYIVTEFCVGGTLQDHIRTSGLDDSDKGPARVMVQIFRAMYYLHNLGICHRDMKPENCLVSTYRIIDESNALSNVRVCDFGLSCNFRRGEELSSCVGTLRFMAPEVLDKSYSHSCDIWSCGITMYNLLCGFCPFTGKTDADIKTKIRTGKLIFSSEWAHVASDAMALIRKLLVVKAGERCTIPEAFENPWLKKHCVAATSAVPLDISLISNLLGFRSLNKLKRAALHIVASMLDDRTLSELRRVFIALDANHDGLLSIAEVKEKVEKSYGSEVTDPLVRSLLRHDVSDDNHHSFTYTEFLAATLDRARCCKKDMCWAAFVTLDADGDGKISIKELADNNVLGQLEQADLQQLLELLDENGDGEIDFEEFTAMMRDSEGWTPKSSPCRTPVKKTKSAGDDSPSKKSERSDSTWGSPSSVSPSPDRVRKSEPQAPAKGTSTSTTPRVSLSKFMQWRK